MELFEPCKLTSNPRADSMCLLLIELHYVVPCGSAMLVAATVIVQKVGHRLHHSQRITLAWPARAQSRNQA